MKHVFQNKKITGMLTVLPNKECCFDDEMDNYDFPRHQTMRLKKLMGFDKHRVVSDKTTVSDLCIFGIEHLLESGYLKKDDVNGLILVTQSPDYYMPPTSNVIQGALGLNKDIVCMDINQGCCGFLLGLMQAFMLLDLNGINKVILLNADVLSRKVSIKDRNSYPLSGDAATITIVENSAEHKSIPFHLYMDGTRSDTLIIPAGGFRMLSDERTKVLTDAGDGNKRSMNHLRMDGAEVFSFVQQEIPPLIEEIRAFANLTDPEIDYYLFHQPNRFMLEKLCARMCVDKKKMPMNIVEQYGNSSGCTIPVNITHNLGDELLKNQYKCCLSAFGSGLTWGAMVMDLGTFDFIGQIVSPY